MVLVITQKSHELITYVLLYYVLSGYIQIVIIEERSKNTSG